jgi:hypothetical protein
MLVLIHITSATDGTRVKRVPVQSRNPGSEIVLALPDLVETKSKTITVNPPKHHHGTKETGTTKAGPIGQSTWKKASQRANQPVDIDIPPHR